MYSTPHVNCRRGAHAMFPPHHRTYLGPIILVFVGAMIWGLVVERSVSLRTEHCLDSVCLTDALISSETLPTSVSAKDTAAEFNHLTGRTGTQPFRIPRGKNRPRIFLGYTSTNPTLRTKNKTAQKHINQRVDNPCVTGRISSGSLNSRTVHSSAP